MWFKGTSRGLDESGGYGGCGKWSDNGYIFFKESKVLPMN